LPREKLFEDSGKRGIYFKSRYPRAPFQKAGGHRAKAGAYFPDLFSSPQFHSV
jgi:hypothetical protein